MPSEFGATGNPPNAYPQGCGTEDHAAEVLVVGSGDRDRGQRATQPHTNTNWQAPCTANLTAYIAQVTKPVLCAWKRRFRGTESGRSRHILGLAVP